MYPSVHVFQHPEMVSLYYSCSTPVGSLLGKTKSEVTTGSAELSVSS